jgi:hypothetical protein
MRIADRVEEEKLVISARVAGIVCVGAACLLAATPVQAQERTGVSHPDPVVITTSPDVDPAPAPVKAAAKPSAAIPATSPSGTSGTVYGPYVPYHAPGTPAPTAQKEAAFDPDANIVTEATAGKSDRRLLSDALNDKNDPDAGIVMHVPSKAGEIPDGTLVKARLRETLSTMTTQPGTKFTAVVSAPVMRDGKVIVPEGAMLEGRVTWVRGGKRIGGPAAIHLEPRTVTLPDGSQYILHAGVIDTDSWDNTGVDDEGTITRKQNGKKTLGAMALATGGPMAAGAVIGGLPGAVIGAGVGAGVGTVIWLKQDRQAELPKDLELVFSLTEPMSTTPLNAAVAPAKAKSPGGE